MSLISKERLGKLLLTAIAASLIACQNKQPINTTDIVLETIQKDTEKIKQSLNVLRQIKESNTTPLALYSYHKPTSGPLTNQISLEWAGDPEQALRQIASDIGFKVTTSGRKPINLNHVIVHSGYKTAIDMIEDIGWQAGSAMGVMVNNEQSMIHIVYAQRQTQLHE